jgi:serine/threonine protein kinase
MNNLISAAAAGDMEEVRMIVASSGSGGGGGGGMMDLSGSRKKQDSQHGGGILSRKGSIGGIVDMVKTPLDLSGSRRLGGSSSGGGGTGGVNLDTSSSNVNQSALDINKGDYDHRTALHLAASEGHIDVVKFLCQHGANVNVQDRWGGRPLDDALSKGNEGVAKVLLEYGATSDHNDDEKGGSSGHSSQNHFRRSNKLSLTGSEVDTDGEDENLRVEFSELEMIERIGSGAFGEIYKCRWRGILVAAKCIKASKIQKEWLLKKQIQKHNRIEDRVEAIKQSQITDEEKELALEDFRKETAIMRRLRHPNIVMMLAYSHTDDVEVMISEICRCSLLDIFKANAINNSNLPKQTQIKYAQQLAAGMNHLHKSRPPIIHRDLKPANLLIDFSGTLKIADFGLAKIRPNPEQNEVEAFQMTGETGSYRFMAPEVFRHEEYSETVDVYSYAMIFYYMLRSIPPWSGLSGVDAATKAAVDGERPIIPRDVDERLSLLLKRCWDENPTARPSFEEIITSLSIYSHDVYKTDTDNPQWEAESKCMPGGCVIS